MARAMTMGRLAIRNGLSNTKINGSVIIRDKKLRPVMTSLAKFAYDGGSNTLSEVGLSTRANRRYRMRPTSRRTCIAGLSSLIPRLVDQDPWAQLRRPMDMIRQG